MYEYMMDGSNAWEETTSLTSQTGSGSKRNDEQTDQMKEKRSNRHKEPGFIQVPFFAIISPHDRLRKTPPGASSNPRTQKQRGTKKVLEEVEQRRRIIYRQHYQKLRIESKG